MLKVLDDKFGEYEWRDEPSAAWAWNMLLFDAPRQYVDSLLMTDTEDLAELRALASTFEPSEIGVQVKRGVVGLAS
jgi:hypothetical protein